jgi:hypothetical protein
MKRKWMLLLLAVVLPAVGESEKPRPSHWGAGGQMPAENSRKDAHQRMLDKYDTNKDGKLDEAERKAMKK